MNRLDRIAFILLGALNDELEQDDAPSEAKDEAPPTAPPMATKKARKPRAKSSAPKKDGEA